MIRSLCILTAALACLAPLTRATTIVSVAGPNIIFSIADSQYGAARWSSPSAYQNVSIRALLTGDGVAPISVFLTRQIGPGTTVADQLLTTTTTPNGINVWTTLFSGLTLEAGSYFLVMSGVQSFSTGWGAAPEPNVITLGPRVTIDSYFSNALIGVLNPLFPPASPFATLNLTPWVFEVTGDPVPEPSMTLLLALALVMVSFCRGRSTNRELEAA